MKKTLLHFLAMAFLAVSCHVEVVIPVGEDEPTGVMNAQLNTLDSSHSVYLSVSQKSGLRALPGAEVRVFVNGAHVASAAEVPPPYEGVRETTYLFDATFAPGDEVRIEARKGSINLSATVTAPPAVTISSIDTSTVMLTYMGDMSTYLQAKTSFQDVPGTSFYRVYGHLQDEFAYLDEEGNPIPDLSGVADSGLWMETGFDPVISEGGGKTGGLDLAALLDAQNPYHCFSDMPFSDRECTIRPLFYHGGVLLPEVAYGIYIPESMQNDVDSWEALRNLPRRVHRRASVQVISLDFAQYHYLKALENLDLFGTEMSFLVEPTTLPSNVEGGLGFVALDTVSEFLFYEDTRTYPALKDNLYY